MFFNPLGIVEECGHSIGKFNPNMSYNDDIIWVIVHRRTGYCYAAGRKSIPNAIEPSIRNYENAVKYVKNNGEWVIE